MEKEQAYQQIEALQNILKASHSFLKESKFHIEGGILMVLVPLIGITRSFVTTSNISSASTIKIFYLTILMAICAIFVKRNIKQKRKLNQNLHPILKKVRQYFTIHYIGLVIILVILHLNHLKALWLPVFFIFYGININLIGRFSHKPIQYSSWIYISLGGIVGILLAKGIITDSEMLNYIQFAFVGICHLIVGLLMRRNEQSSLSE